MTIKNDLILWDDGVNCLCLLSIPSEQQYKYIDGLPCITFGASYENTNFKGYDTFTLFDRFYNNILNEMKNTYDSLNGTFRICDIGADTDGYIEFVLKNKSQFSADARDNVLNNFSEAKMAESYLSLYDQISR